MKRILALFSILTGILLGQSYNTSNSSNTVHLITGTVVPGSCIKNDMFLKLDATPPQNLYLCPAGTFVQSTGTSGPPAGNAGGDLTGSTYPNPTVATVGGVGAASIAAGVNIANAATSAATNNAVVRRDASGGFSAGVITATQFNGSGVGLTSIPISGLTAGDFSSKINSGTYSINVTGSAGSVAWTNVTSRPTNVSSFANDAGYITAGGTAAAVGWTGVTGKPAAWLDATNLAAVTPADINTAFASGFYSNTTVTNAPVAGWFTTVHARSQSAGNYAFDLLFPHGTENLYFRAKNDTTTGTWRQMLLEDGRTYGVNISGNAATASSVTWASVSGRPTSLSGFTNDISAVLTTNLYTDPSWLSLSKAKVGLSAVENTALSTWAGSANITALGTIAVGSVPWSLVTGKPTNVSGFTNDAGFITLNPVGTVTISGSSASTGQLSVYTGQLGSTAVERLRVDPADGQVKAGNFNIYGVTGGTINASRTAYIDSSGNGNFNGTITASQFSGSGAGVTGLTATNLTAGDFSSKINSGTYSINISGNAATVTNGLYSTGSYSDPAWLTISRTKVGLSAVENTALSTWAGSTNITTIGTLSAGTVPWARLSGVPTTFTPTAHTHLSADVTDATNLATANMLVKRDASGNFSAGTVTATLAGNASTASALAADPTDCSGNNWSRGINASGTAQCAQLDFSNLSGSPTIAQLPAGDYSGKVTSGTYSISISGNAATATTATTANSVTWTNVSSRPTNVSVFTNDSGYQTGTYIQSRGMNLITNGSGLLGTNYNFSNFTFAQSDTYGGKGSFKNSTMSATVESDEFIPVDGSKTYKLSVWAKSTTHAVGAHAYIGITPYDVENLMISPEMYMRASGSDTTLASTLSPGDTVVHLTSSTGWLNGNDAWYLHQMVIWDYTNGFGYKWPAYTYSRHNSYYYASYQIGTGAWAAGGVSGNNITLSAPWPASLGTIPAGTAVSNSLSGGTYKYIAAGNVDIPAAWTNYTGIIGGWDTGGANATNLFPYGTANIRLLFLLNRDVAGNTTNFSNLWFSELTAANIEYASASQPGIIQLGDQTMGTGNKTFGGWIAATQFNGSGAGLSSSTVPVAALVAGDYSSRINAGTYSINISGNAATVTNGLYSTGSYSDPPWLTISKSKVGLSAVENTALSTWAGSSNITTIGTLSAGTVPWARLSGVPSTFAPSTHTHVSSDITDATNLSTANMLVKRDASGNFSAGTITATLAGNASTASALTADPAACPANNWVSDIAANGTLTCTQPSFANLSGSATIAQLTAGDYSSKITSGTYSISISGNAATATTATTANAVAWANVTSRPTAVSAFTNDSGYLTIASSIAISQLTAGDYSSKITSGTYSIAISGTAASATNATTASTAGQLSFFDVRTLAPSNGAANRLQFGFTSWTNNSTGPYADFLHLRSYQDASGGNDNLVLFRKDTIGMRIYQQTWGSATAYSTYKDMAFTDGTNASGTWGISIAGNAATATTAGTANAVTWANVSGKPTTVSSWSNDAGYLTAASSIAISQLAAGDYSAKITSGTYSIGISGNAATATTAASANAVTWANVSGKPTSLSSFTNDSGYLTSLNSATRVNNTVTNSANMAFGCAGNSCWTTANGTLYFYGSNVQHGALAWYPGQGFAVMDVGAYAPDNSMPAFGSRLGASLFALNLNASGQFNGSGAGITGLNASNLSAGDFSSKINSGTYAISISGNAATATTASGVAWANVGGKPTNVSSFTNDAGYLTSSISSQVVFNPGGPNIYSIGLGQTANVSGLSATSYNGGMIFYGFNAPGGHGYLVYRPTGTPTPAFYLTGGTGYDYGNVGLVVNGPITANTQFNGSGAGLTASTVPITALVAGDYSGKLTSGTYSINVSGSAGSVAWSNVSGRPTALSAFTNDAGYLTSASGIAISQLAAGDYSAKITSGTYGISISGNAATATNSTQLGGLGLCTAGNCAQANTVVRTDTNGYANMGWISTVSGDNGTTAINRVYASSDSYIRYYQPAEAFRQMGNAKVRQMSFTFGDGANAISAVTNLPVMWMKNWGIAVTKTSCIVDSGTVNLTMTSQTNGMTSSATACTSAGVDTTSGFNGYATIASGSWMGFTTTIASGTPKYIHVTVSYAMN